MIGVVDKLLYIVADFMALDSRLVGIHLNVDNGIDNGAIAMHREVMHSEDALLFADQLHHILDKPTVWLLANKDFCGRFHNSNSGRNDKNGDSQSEEAIHVIAGQPGNHNTGYDKDGRNDIVPGILAQSRQLKGIDPLPQRVVKSRLEELDEDGSNKDHKGNSQIYA